MKLKKFPNSLKVALQVGAFILMWQLIQAWQQRDLLDDDGQITMPALVLPTMEGKVAQILPENRSRPTLLYFFAPWCSVCHASIDNVFDARQRLGPEAFDVVYVALSWRDKNEVSGFLAQHRLAGEVLLGDEQTRRNFKIRGFPTYYLVNAGGKVESASMGYSTELGILLKAI